MKRLLVVSALSLLLHANEARAQFYVQTVTPGAYVPLASLPGVQNVTAFTFSSQDEGNATVPIPFVYNYLSQPFVEARVAVNGYVVFGQNSDFGSYFNYPIGSTDGAENVIAVWWDDLIVRATAGFASYGTLGVAPNRIFVIEVREWEHYGLADISDGNWQVWLYEGASGRFEVRADGQLDAAENYTASTGWEGLNSAPSGVFLPCAATADCDHLDFDGLTGNVYAVEQAQGPELLGTIGTAPRGALPGQSAPVQVTLRNVGTQSVANVESGLYLSLDSVVDGTDLRVATFTVPQLLAGNVPVILTATAAVPNNALPRDWFLLLSVDSNNTVAEVAENNNVAPAQGRFATAFDLAALEALSGSGANPGDPIDVDIEIGNQGVPYFGAVTVRVHASTNQTFEATDPVIGTSVVNLAGAAIDSFSLALTLPSLPPGEYYPLLRVDPNAQIVEYDEADNVRSGSQPFPVGPDLTIASFSSPGGADPGQPITFTVLVQNDGVPQNGGVEVRFIASPDPIYDINDPVLGTTSVQLSGLASESVQATINLPLLPAGVYFPIAIIDPNDQIDEANEFNNTAVSTDVFTSGPDFTIVDIDGPTQATPGQPMMITTAVGSGGAPYTGPVAYRLYLSADMTLDATDTNVGQFTVTFAGETSLADAQQPLFPAALPPTGHYLIGVVDPQLVIGEAAEANNVLVDDQRIGSGTDLRIDSVDFDPGTARPGDEVLVDFTLRAEGSPFVGMVEYTISLSRDGTPDANDLRVLDGSFFVNGVEDNAITATVGIDAAIPPGDYEFIVVADPADRVVEPSETNNYDNSFFEIEIEGPNLAVSNLVAANQAFVGIPYRVELTIINADVANAASFRYGYYYTTNGLLRPPDGTELLTMTTAAIPAGESRTLIDMIDIPPQQAQSRTVQFGVILDVDNVVNESDEADNLHFYPGLLQVLVPVSDLSARIDETSLEAAAGEDLAVTRTLRNLGVADATSFTYGYYLSTNTEISAGDDLLIATHTSQLAVDELDYSIDIVNLPATVPPGTYYLGLLADPEDALLETDETNNAGLGPELTVYPAALRVATAQLPSAVLGAAYSAQLFASGATLDATWSITSGTLPPGLALDQLAGVIAGTPNEDGLYPFVVRVTVGNAYAEAELGLRVRGATVPIEVLTLMLPYAIVGRPYQTELVAVGGASPYRWGVRSTLPPGLTATSTGGVGGTPSQAGAYLLSVVVTDADGEAATAEVALNVVNAEQTVRITQAPLPEASLGDEYCDVEPIRFYASGGFPPYVWSVPRGTKLPGLSLSEAGELCGTPMETGDFPLLVRVEDVAGVFDTALFILRVRADGDLSVAETSLPDANVGEPYLAKLTARQGMEPYVWRIYSGALPSGIELSEDGIISGTPAMLETAVFAVQVTDRAMQAKLHPLSLSVVDGDGDGDGCGCNAARAESGSAAFLLLLFGLVLLRRSSRL